MRKQTKTSLVIASSAALILGASVPASAADAWHAVFEGKTGNGQKVQTPKPVTGTEVVSTLRASASSVFDVFASFGPYGTAVDRNGHQAHLATPERTTAIASGWWTTNPADQADLEFVVEWLGEPLTGGLSTPSTPGALGTSTSAPDPNAATGIANLDEASTVVSDLVSAEEEQRSTYLSEASEAPAIELGGESDGTRYLAVDNSGEIGFVTILSDGTIGIGVTTPEDLEGANLALSVTGKEDSANAYLLSDGLSLVENNPYVEQLGNLVIDSRAESARVPLTARSTGENSPRSQVDDTGAVQELSVIDW